jgi:uncharacterized Zn finger protein
MIVPGKDGQVTKTVDISQTTPIKCDKCENQTFKNTLILRKLSALISPNGQEQYIPVAVFACEKCGHVNTEFVDMETE